MWTEEFTGFLLDFGFTQSITDRRLFPLTDEGGLLLVVGTFVDDFKVVVQSESNADKFTRAWEERYRDPPDVEATARGFVGLKYTRDDPVITISCNKATNDLAKKLSGLTTPWSRSAVHDAAAGEVPLPAGARCRARQSIAARLSASPSAQNLGTRWVGRVPCPTRCQLLSPGG